MQLYRLLPLYVGLLGWLGSCAPSPETDANPEAKVLARAVRAHGMEGFDSVQIHFTFRERDYGIEQRNGRFTYTRTFADSLGNAVRDVLTNEGLVRYRNDSVQTLTSKDSAAYAASVNSVRYFFVLPYGLSDPAVQARLLDTATIAGRAYDRVRITFDEEGGGEDHEDVYHYFFNQVTGELDYLAYTFEADEGGIRFREAVNKRRVDGVLVQDYVNYGLDGDDRGIDRIAERFLAGELPELSRIQNAAVRIQ
ncbi:hypothetical protein CLV84_3281 [Neolewinella xylanilytica]|uniref:Deoxyribose-phosphate aldolase n=1 Tax=Neolewinella xylanilytica TaxID=1514080 RepID=A0A2S6I5C6_9BACT|nr:DUF6503 family protein [Neolewinella xylanilytica]PPK86355.1 hypothetical protein CLV84_3281 [Neolewinella xylanilytica]